MNMQLYRRADSCCSIYSVQGSKHTYVGISSHITHAATGEEHSAAILTLAEYVLGKQLSNTVPLHLAVSSGYEIRMAQLLQVWQQGTYHGA